MRLPFAASLALCLISLSGCIAYPKFYWTTKSGTARLEDGKPITIKAALIKSCESYQGEKEKEIRVRQTRTDDKGRYSLTIRGMAFNVKNFLSDSGCASRIQMFICREVCKPVDEIDINILGK